MQSIILSRLVVTQQCDKQTDGQTDILANAALHWAAMPKRL